MKRIVKIVTLCLLISLFTLSCKKEHVATQNNASPVFSFTGLVGGIAMNLRAGLNNYYMYSSYSQDSAGGVYSYTGNLKEYNCNSNCPPSIEFIINNYHTLPLGASESNIGKSLATGYLGYLTPGGTPDSISLTFTPAADTSVKVKSYTWDFGDGTKATINSSVLSSIKHTYSHAGSYNSSLLVTFNDNTSKTLSNPLQMGNTNVSLNCSITDSGITFMSSALGGSGNYTYHWDFGDPASGGTNDTANTLNAAHTFSDTNPHSVTLTVHDIINNIKDSSIAYAAAPNSTARSHVFSYSTSNLNLVPNSKGLANATIIYTDATGDQYTSNNVAQPDSSYFQITSVTNYQNNENNQSTKQLHVRFDCILFDYTGNTLAIKNGDAIIAVAYK
jgi:hypothetical protein